jgi:hypothetical protein
MEGQNMPNNVDGSVPNNSESDTSASRFGGAPAPQQKQYDFVCQEVQ